MYLGSRSKVYFPTYGKNRHCTDARKAKKRISNCKLTYNLNIKTAIYLGRESTMKCQRR